MINYNGCDNKRNSEKSSNADKQSFPLESSCQNKTENYREQQRKFLHQQELPTSNRTTELKATLTQNQNLLSW